MNQKGKYKSVLLFALFAIGITTLLLGTTIGVRTTESPPSETAEDTPSIATSSREPATAIQTASSSVNQLAAAGSSTREKVLTETTYATSSPHTASYIEVTDSCGPNYKGECLLVRSGPSQDMSVVTRLRNGQVLKVAETLTVDGRLWYRIEFDEWLRYPNRVDHSWYIAGQYVQPREATATSTPSPTNHNPDKKIIVDLSSQHIAAYEGAELFMQEAVSTGKQLYPTPRGKFPIYKMTPSRYMQGPIPNISNDYYDLPGVPWNLYFTYQGAVIHGAYWHDNFGRPWSHGCVNLPPEKAEKLYRWAELGTTVIVQD